MSKVKMRRVIETIIGACIWIFLLYLGCVVVGTFVGWVLSLLGVA